MARYKKLVIGIDQSYKRTGVSVCADGAVKAVTSWKLDSLKNNTERRRAVQEAMVKLLQKVVPKADETIVIIERIRLSSQGFVSIDYIKSIGALCCVIIDAAKTFGVKTYSVDTRSWKSQVVGTSKPRKNKFGVDPHKWPTIQFVSKMGLENKIVYEVQNKTKKKGVFEKEGKRYSYNDDAADSVCIALYGFAKDQKLKEET